MVDFIQQNFVAKAKNSKQLITSDARNNSYSYKFTSICELAPICRDDLVILPPKLCKELGGIGPIVLVYKVTTSVHIVDVHTMRTHEIDAVNYWQYTFKNLCGRERLQPFIVINVEELDQADFSVSRATIRNKFKMC
jgi:nonsense-mediated mRNA decay protein 3